MYIAGRKSSRHMTGKQAMTLYLPPRKYWMLKWRSQHTGDSMLTLARLALDAALVDAGRRA
jgi:hypothetical protein